MSDKLHIEIDMYNGELNDAIPALIYLANELVESGTIEIESPVNWKEKQSTQYQVKWRFSEDELHLPFDVDFAHQLNDELRELNGIITKKEKSAIGSLQKLLENCLRANGLTLFEVE